MFTNAHEDNNLGFEIKKSKYTFNYHTMKKMNNNKQMRSDWMFIQKWCQGKRKIKNQLKKRFIALRNQKSY